MVNGRWKKCLWSVDTEQLTRGQKENESEDEIENEPKAKMRAPFHIQSIASRVNVAFLVVP